MINKSIFMAGVTIALAGCATGGINDSANKIESESNMVADVFNASQQYSDESSSVQTVNGIWVAGEAFALSDRDTLPEFFSNPAAYAAYDPVSFQDMVSEISAAIDKRIILTFDAQGVIAELESEAEDRDEGDQADTAGSLRSLTSKGLRGSGLLFQLEHAGTIKSLLDAITIKANLFWKYESNSILIFRNETKTFILDSIAGTSEFKATVRSDGEASRGDESGTSGITSLETSVEYKPKDPYIDIKQAFDAIKTQFGSYSISEQTGTVSFTDTPIVLDKVAAYIDQLNAIVNQKISVRTEIYEVTIDDGAEVGLDFSAMYSGSSDFSLSLMNASNTSVAGGLPLIDFGIIKSGSDFNGTKAFMNALRSVAKVSLVTTSNVYTTNGQPVPLQVLDTTTYLKERKAILGEEGEIEAVELTPGVTTEGISMTLLPKISSSNDILMQVAMDLSMIKEIKEFGDENGTIQLPARAVKNFLQRVSLESGNTVMISGFERIINRDDTSSLGNSDFWMFGGKKKGGEKRVMTVILLTPYIMQR